MRSGQSFAREAYPHSAALGGLAERRKPAAAVSAVAQVATDQLLAVRADPEVLRSSGQGGSAVCVRDELGHDIHPLAGDLVVVADLLAARLHAVDGDHGFPPRRRGPQAVSLGPSHYGGQDSKGSGLLDGCRPLSFLSSAWCGC